MILEENISHILTFISLQINIKAKKYEGTIPDTPQHVQRSTLFCLLDNPVMLDPLNY